MLLIGKKEFNVVVNQFVVEVVNYESDMFDCEICNFKIELELCWELVNNLFMVIIQCYGMCVVGLCGIYEGDLVFDCFDQLQKGNLGGWL